MRAYLVFVSLVALGTFGMACIGLANAHMWPEYGRRIGGSVLTVTGVALAFLGATREGIRFQEVPLGTRLWNPERLLVQVFGMGYFRAKAIIVGGGFAALGIKAIVRQ